MKVWKKMLCMALCLSMATTAMGCDKIRGAFGGGDSASDSFGWEMSGEPDVIADSIFDGAVATLENMKSCEVTFTVSGAVKSEYFNEDGSSEVNSSPVEMTVNVVVSQQAVKLTAIQASQNYEYDDEGNAIITDIISVNEQVITAEYSYDRSYYYGVNATQAEITEIANAEKWYKTETTVADDLSTSIQETFGEIPVELIEKLLATKEVKQAQEVIETAIKDNIADAIKAGKIKNGKATYEEDFADDVNSVISFLENIDENKDTLGNVINRALATVAPGLTAEALLGQIKAYTKMTVAEALTSIDELLTANYNTNLQAIKDAIVNSEIMGVLFTDVLEMDAETIAQIKAWQVSSLKEDPEIKDLIIGDLINSFMIENGMVEAPVEGEEPIDYCAEYLAIIETALETTLAELGVEIPSFKGVHINEVKVSSEMLINSKYWVEAVSGGLSLDLEVEEFDYETGALSYSTSLDIGLAVSITKISDKTVDIEIPADANCNVVTDK